MRTLLVLISLFGAAVAGSTAQAHAFLDHASPLVGSTVQTGSFKVNWRALSVDTHTTQGSFSFRVGSP